MSWFSDFFITRAIANTFGFKGFERDVFFALNYLSHQNKNQKRFHCKNENNSITNENKQPDDEQKEVDLIVQCTNETYIKSIKYVANYLSDRENRNKTARIEVYKKATIEE